MVLKKTFLTIKFRADSVLTWLMSTTSRTRQSPKSSAAAAFVFNETLGGISAGVIGTLIGYPLDVVKTRMQYSRSSSPNFVAAVRDIARVEGIKAMYKGCAAPMLSLSILNALNFSTYGAAKRVLLPAEAVESPGFRMVSVKIGSFSN